MTMSMRTQVPADRADTSGRRDNNNADMRRNHNCLAVAHATAMRPAMPTNTAAATGLCRRDCRQCGGHNKRDSNVFRHGDSPIANTMYGKHSCAAFGRMQVQKSYGIANRLAMFSVDQSSATIVMPS